MWVQLRSWTGWAASLANLARWTQKSLPLSVQLSLWCKLNCTDCFLHATRVFSAHCDACSWCLSSPVYSDVPVSVSVVSGCDEPRAVREIIHLTSSRCRVWCLSIVMLIGSDRCPVCVLGADVQRSILSRKQSRRKTGSNDFCLGIIKQNYRYTERRLKNEMNSRDNFCPLLGGKCRHLFPIHLGLFRVQQVYTWHTVSHKLPIWFFNDVDWRV